MEYSINKETFNQLLTAGLTCVNVKNKLIVFPINGIAFVYQLDDDDKLSQANESVNVEIDG